MRLIYFTLGWVGGLFIAAALAALIPLYWLVMLALATTLTAFAWRTRWRWVALALFAFALAGYRYAFVPQTSDVARYNDQGNVTIEGVLLSAPDIRDDRIQIRVASEVIDVSDGAFLTQGVVLVNAPRTAELQYGDRVRATGRLATPAEFDTFSYADFLARQGVFSVMQEALVEVIDSGNGSVFYRNLFQLKARAQSAINAALPDPQAALLSGILLGNERGIEPDLQTAFQRTGASHIIAISGFNMVIISALVMRLFQATVRHRGIATILGLVVIGLYTLFVGANAAVVRAAIMSGVWIIGQRFERRTYIPSSLAFVTLLMTLHNPLVLWSISFQLSFFAVLGLALFTEPLANSFERLLQATLPRGLGQQIAAVLNEPLIVTLASLSLTMPLTIIYFQRFSVLVVLVNMLIVPVQAALLIVGGIAVLVSFASPALAQILFWIDMLLLSWSINIVRVFAVLPFADAGLILDERVIGAVYILVIVGAIVNATRPPWLQRVLRFIQRRQLVLTLMLLGVALSTLLFARIASRPDGRLHVWWLDVGHSNAVLVQTPGGAHILVDGGRFPSRLLTAIGDRLPFYDRTLELVVISQPDRFDTAALPAVLERYNAGAILVNGQPNETDVSEQLRAVLGDQPTINTVAGYTVTFDDGTLLEVLHPQQTPAFDDFLNDGTVVLRLQYGDVSILLPGDLSIVGQQALLDAGQWPLATVLQLPQQGTQRSLSETFLAATQPQLTILQSDASNFRGDPAVETLALVEGLPLLRTDEQGTIHLWTDGRTLWALPQR